MHLAFSRRGLYVYLWVCTVLKLKGRDLVVSVPLAYPCHSPDIYIN